MAQHVQEGHQHEATFIQVTLPCMDKVLWVEVAGMGGASRRGGGLPVVKG